MIRGRGAGHGNPVGRSMILDLVLSAADAVELDEVDVGVGAVAAVCIGTSATGLSEIAIFGGGGLGCCGNSGGSRCTRDLDLSSSGEAGALIFAAPGSGGSSGGRTGDCDIGMSLAGDEIVYRSTLDRDLSTSGDLGTFTAGAGGGPGGGAGGGVGACCSMLWSGLYVNDGDVNVVSFSPGTAGRC